MGLAVPGSAAQLCGKQLLDVVKNATQRHALFSTAAWQSRHRQENLRKR